jgi:hypothetical protein
MFKVRVMSPWDKYLQLETTLFDTRIKSEDADALLCYWAPSEELFNFTGPKAWYCCEPECQFTEMAGRKWVELRKRLAVKEFLFHNHPDSRYRVPHITHYQKLDVNENPSRLVRAVSVVSNFGGGPRKRHLQIRYRNQFITHSLVDLYGRSSWQKFRKGLFSFPRVPLNYKGEIPGDWPEGEKRELLSKYKVCVCLENMIEAHYFTEKFVEAVTAGCIPVYRAHGSLVGTVLKGAMWVDPADYDDDPQKTLDAALAMDLSTFQVNNSKWLRTHVFGDAFHGSVFRTISDILSGAETIE